MDTQSLEKLPWSFLFLLAVCIFGKDLDLSLLCLFGLIQNWNAVLNLVLLPQVVTVGLGTASLFTVLGIMRYVKGLKQNDPPPKALVAKPMLFPCRTNHNRLFPKKHSFSYSYLFVGIPVGWRGSVGGMISADVELRSLPWYSKLFSLAFWGPWYTVHSDDYLERGHVSGGLREKLDNYLLSQNVDPSTYPEAYLLTAARFLSYAFNPLSIWYLYTPTMELGALILEVNNTFDERHPYFLQASPSSDQSQESKTFTGSWAKEFYVSPLNSRKGSYSITAYDPLASSMAKKPVEATVTLTSSQSHPKLIARVFSSEAPLNPITMSILQKTKFLVSWWWVGFATFYIRTVKEAYILKFIHHLPWVFRPEPQSRTISRHASSTEIFLESRFRRYLQHLVSQVQVPLTVIYTASGLSSNKVEAFSSPIRLNPDIKTKTIDIKVLIPTFYSSYILYSHDFHAFHAAEREALTLDISNWDNMPLLGYRQDPDSPSQTSTPLPIKNVHLSPFSRAFFRLIQRARLTWPFPVQQSPPTKLSKGEQKCKALDQHWHQHALHKPSSFDTWVLSYCNKEEKRRYKKCLLRAFAAKFLAGGSLELLDAELFLLRGLFAWWVARGL